jgi:translocator protein
MNNIVKLIIAIVIPPAAGGLSGFFTTAEIPGWYQTITKPSWNPPSWLFAPVWTTLYILMGIALYLVWKNETVDARIKKNSPHSFCSSINLEFLLVIDIF